MSNDRLIHDVSWAASTHIVEIFAPCLREEQQREAFAEVYVRIKAAIECFEIQAERLYRRMKPGRN
jgi:hypothetical protein